MGVTPSAKRTVTRSSTAPPRLPAGSFASSPQARVRMQAQRRKGTEPELAIRRATHRLGLRFFVHRRPVKGLRREADMVFPRQRVAVFVDGCFWHGCPRHGRVPYRTNAWYWPEKINSNRTRDVDTDIALAEAGWLSVRVWEHEDPNEAALRIRAVIVGRRSRN